MSGAQDLRTRLSACDIAPVASPMVLEEGEAYDWRGRPIKCIECPHRAMRQDGLCAKGRACIRDRRAWRVRRFLQAHPGLADDYLDHPYFEVRASAARHASIFRLAPLLRDKEPEVRAAAVLRLPEERVRHMAHDEDSLVRLAAAARLSGKELVAMLNDTDSRIRVAIIQRMPEALLPLSMRDPDPEVRRAVARRLPPEAVIEMAFDPDAVVRLEVAQRLSLPRLPVLIRDSDMRVRFTVAERIAEEELGPLLDDPEAPIREIAEERLRAAGLWDRIAGSRQEGTILKLVPQPVPHDPASILPSVPKEPKP